MPQLTYTFQSDSAVHSLDMILVEGTRGHPYVFGEENASQKVEIGDFFIGKFTVMQSLWSHVMGANPSIGRGDKRPVENISWNEIWNRDGFLDRINASSVLSRIARDAQAALKLPSAASIRFRLPSETEWEYAARGGQCWTDRFRWSGSNDIEAVAWYKDNSRDLMRDVGLKAPNQLGIYDMSGNAWEWCQDSFTRDINQIPTDGTAFIGDSDERILRGGCYHNWAIHCTVSKRYEIGAAYSDGCIGFRLALSAS